MKFNSLNTILFSILMLGVSSASIAAEPSSDQSKLVVHRVSEIKNATPLCSAVITSLHGSGVTFVKKNGVDVFTSASDKLVFGKLVDEGDKKHLPFIYNDGTGIKVSAEFVYTLNSDHTANVQLGSCQFTTKSTPVS